MEYEVLDMFFSFHNLKYNLMLSYLMDYYLFMLNQIFTIMNLTYCLNYLNFIKHCKHHLINMLLNFLDFIQVNIKNYLFLSILRNL